MSRSTWHEVIGVVIGWIALFACLCFFVKQGHHKPSATGACLHDTHWCINMPKARCLGDVRHFMGDDTSCQKDYPNYPMPRFASRTTSEHLTKTFPHKAGVCIYDVQLFIHDAVAMNLWKTSCLDMGGFWDEDHVCCGNLALLNRFWGVDQSSGTVGWSPSQEG